RASPGAATGTGSASTSRAPGRWPSRGMRPRRSSRTTIRARCCRGSGSARVTISWDDFARVDMRVGVVVDAQEFPEARRPAFKLWVDFGPLGVKRSSAQVTHRYTPRELIGRRVV